MKKLLALTLAAGLSLSLFAADVFKYAPVTGNVKSYTETDFSIATRFGTLYRTPSSLGDYIAVSEKDQSMDTLLINLYEVMRFDDGIAYCDHTLMH